MSAIGSRDTQPELSVRRALHARGYRFFVARRVAGYRPDVLFMRRRKAIFVHGCFWHGHGSCGRDRVPKTRSDYRRGKIETNKQRDARAQRALEEASWRVLVLWECEVGSTADFTSRLTEFLGPPRWPGNSRLRRPLLVEIKRRGKKPEARNGKLLVEGDRPAEASGGHHREFASES
jgi:DNA mismatch endonuclease, patch repair protein